jgi:hypothetical protein
MSAPSYPGPKTLKNALTRLHIERAEDAAFHREGLRADAMQAHFIYVLRGSITFRFAVSKRSSL